MDVRVSTRGSNIADRTLLADLITPSLINYRNSTDRFPRSSSVEDTLCFWSRSSPVIQLGPGPSTKVHNPRRLRNPSSFPRRPSLLQRQRRMTKIDKILSLILSTRDLSSVVFNDEKRRRILNHSTGITPPNLACHRHDVLGKSKRKRSKESKGR